MNSNKMSARVFGIFFILAFVAYGLGNGLIQSLIDSPHSLSNVYANKVQIIWGAILMTLVHTFLNIGLAVIMFPILKPYNKNMAHGYFGAAIAATVMLVVGGVFLLLMVPLSDVYAKAGSVDIAFLETLGMICNKGNFFSYQIAMAIWGLGGLMFCYLLYKSRLVPPFIPIWGFIGYLIFMSGTIFELFGYNGVGLLLDIPGGLFEIFLSVWLIAKGFKLSNN